MTPTFPTRVLVSLTLVLLPAAEALGERPVRLDLEGGAVWQSRNSFAVPGDTGTRVALAE